ncbi:hypothetical protein D3C85_1523840 [compost metagenome]
MEGEPIPGAAVELTFVEVGIVCVANDSGRKQQNQFRFLVGAVFVGEQMPNAGYGAKSRYAAFTVHRFVLDEPREDLGFSIL